MLWIVLCGVHLDACISIVRALRVPLTRLSHRAKGLPMVPTPPMSSAIRRGSHPKVAGRRTASARRLDHAVDRALCDRRTGSSSSIYKCLPFSFSTRSSRLLCVGCRLLASLNPPAPIRAHTAAAASHTREIVVRSCCRHRVETPPATTSSTSANSTLHGPRTR